ncbi:Spore coat protein CotH [Melioribacter roseus P3M-2]|uniref:Spore coat protein CotH n=1 Tax=Melioribacter roseus (strain DSM 23840 / JCM 17771 / VKM B-2668 / P3M-2) TaxID=1191523 RepID=I7A2Q8_MELRP|nr:CotH kinase family protein [Melioribacter roseus]AFN74216.1 Spore coat protein CotH [Melioribacter roseus P3M-2]
MIITLILIALGFGSVFANSNSADHWETVVYSSDVWKYRPGNSSPDADWNQLYYDDTSWMEGRGGIGYGDGDDNTIIEQTISLFLRIKFNIVDTSLIESALLHADYDDAFVAYINGVEVARAGISGNPPEYNKFADSEHEAKMYGGGAPEEFEIKKEILKNILIPGENLLAVQVHNASAASTDLSSNFFLSFGIGDSSRSYRSTPEWFDEPFEFSSSDLSIIVIDTEGGTIVHEPKIMAKMGIIYNCPGNRNNITDPFNEYDGWIGIEYRGNASFRISDKKPYTIETRKEDGSNRNVELLGLPKENDFVLRAVYIDKTLMRDALAYYMYRSMGKWAPRTRHVELVLNGEYQGVYVLEEKIKPDKNRLDIAKMDSADTSGEALTGGYIWCVNRRWGDEEHNDLLFDSTEADGNPRFLKYPQPDEVMPQQLEYIRNLEQEFCDVMAGPNYNVPFIGYDKYIEVSSFIDEIIIQELTGNSDAYSYSSYFYKDRGKKICAGPIWDFDQALCNSTHHNGDRYDEWRIKIPDGARPQFWDKLFGDKEIQKQLKNKWTEYRQESLKTERIIAFIDSVANYLQEAQEHNFKKWPILGVSIWRSLPGAEERDTYHKEVDFMKEWLINRLEWMDVQLYQTTDVENLSTGKITEFKLYPNYPNPFNPSTVIKYQVPKYEKVTLKIYNTLGQEITTLVDGLKAPGIYEEKFDGNNLPSGIYFYRLQTESGYSDTRKFLLLK